MSPEILFRVCNGNSRPSESEKSRLKIKPAILHSFCRHKVQHCDYPAIIRSETSTVRGTYVHGLTEGDLWRLDTFEGNQYRREKVAVRILERVGDERGEGNVEGEGEVQTETYVWVAAADMLEEGEWDFAEFRREKIQRWLGDREDYHGEFGLWIREVSKGLGPRLTFANHDRDVDEAVRTQEGDPTGGRGSSGPITAQLEAAEEEKVFESAV
ncbi:hypothetical protein MMC20_001187 [Loxospora ochrophaea]|nr:hypothetical protein [Loxospora ochrophaea]